MPFYFLFSFRRGYRLVQAYRPKFVKHPMPMPFLETDPETSHTCSMSPCQAVDEWGFRFLKNRPMFYFCFFGGGDLGLRRSKNSGEKQKSIRQPLDRGS